MGTINRRCLYVLLLASCMSCTDYLDYQCGPASIGSPIFKFIPNTLDDSLQVGERVRFAGAIKLPDISGFTTDKLPEMPTLVVRVYQISDTVLLGSASYVRPFTGRANRPFFVRTNPGSSRYTENWKFEVDGIQDVDTLRIQFELEALAAGVYELEFETRPNSYYGHPLQVFLDSKRDRCNNFWQISPEYMGTQNHQALSDSFPGYAPSSRFTSYYLFIAP